MKNIVPLFLFLLAVSCSSNCFGETEALIERIKLLEERVRQLEIKLADKEDGNTNGQFSLGNNWYYSTTSGERDEYIEGIFSAMFPEFVRVFGNEAMTHKPVTIFNAPNESSPMAIPRGKTMQIRIVQGNTSYWAQMIYQLSHEMTHYAFFSYFPHADQSNYSTIFENEQSSWNEEIVCEAMSLYMLKYVADNWEKCSLAKINPTFDSPLKEYLTNEYNRGKGHTLKSAGDAVPFEGFHKNFNKATDARNSRLAERNYLYDLLIAADAESIGEIRNMYKYFNKEFRHIDYSAWIKGAKKPNFIEKLSAIQPKLKPL